MKNVLQKKMEKGDLWNLQEKRHDQELFQSSCFIKYYIWNFSLSIFFFKLCILSMKTGRVMAEVPLSA